MSFEFYNASTPTGYTEEMAYRAGVEADITAINGEITTLNGSVTALAEVTGSVDLSGLTTTDKTSLVNAINETVTNIGTNTTNIASNTTAVNSAVAKISNIHIDLVKDYNADNTGATDITSVLNTALSSAVGVTVYLPRGAYKITGKITLPRYAKLVGDRIGLTQGVSSHMDETARLTKVTETTLLMYPDDMVNPTFTMLEDSTIQGVAIIYVNQSTTSTLETEVIKYPTTISAVHGCNILNIRTWGANDFIAATGECINIRDIYGYTVGTAISIKDSGDVCRIENIHLNPNVVRPSDAMFRLSKSRANSIGIYLENVDGVFMSKIHMYAYRTAIKAKGGNGGAQTNFTITDYCFDTVGVAFDLDTDSGWGAVFNDGITITGFSDSADYAGLLRLSRTVSQTNIVPLFFSNLVSYWNPTYVEPTYMVNFQYQYSWDVRFTNTISSLLEKFLSPHSSYISGKIRLGNSELILEKNWQKKNLIKNYDLQIDSNADGTPDSWTKDLGTGDLTVSTDDTGFIKLHTDSGLLTYKGLFERIVLTNACSYTLIVKARTFSATSQVCLKTYDAGYANPVSSYLTFDAKGIATVSSDTAKVIFDIILCPGTAANSNLIIEFVQFVTDSRRYIIQ